MHHKRHQISDTSDSFNTALNTVSSAPEHVQRAEHGKRVVQSVTAKSFAHSGEDLHDIMDNALYVTSDDRDSIFSESTTKLNVGFSLPEQNVLKSIELREIVFPSTLNNITSKNCKLYISESGYGNDNGPVFFTQTIPIGHYSITTLINTLNSMSQCWNPLAIALHNPDNNGAAADHTRGVVNHYQWSYDETNMCVMLKADYDYSSGSTLTPPKAEFQIHCPPCRFNKTYKSLNDRDRRPLLTDIKITSIQVGASQGNDVYTVTFATFGTYHNLVKNSLIETIHLYSTSTVEHSYTLNLVMLYSDAVIPGECTFCVDVTINAGAGNLWLLNSTNAVVGWLRPCATESSLWPTLGFKTSRGLGYSLIPVNNVAFNNTYGTTNTYISLKYPLFPTGQSGALGAADQIIFPTGWSPGQQTPYTYTPSSGCTFENGVLTIPAASIDFETSSPFVSGGTLMLGYMNYYVGDAVFDLRGQYNVMMKVRVNQHQIGNHGIIKHTFDGNKLDTVGPIFAHFTINTHFGTNTVHHAQGVDLGKYHFTTAMADSGVLSVELLDENGEPLSGMETLAWQCTFNLRFKKQVVV